MFLWESIKPKQCFFKILQENILTLNYVYVVVNHFLSIGYSVFWRFWNPRLPIPSVYMSQTICSL